MLIKHFSEDQTEKYQLLIFNELHLYFMPFLSTRSEHTYFLRTLPKGYN